MDGYKEFQGKTLDDAIREACTYFDAAREKLEIDIVQDAKSGIFGLVGARKAKVRARRVQLPRSVEDVVGKPREEAPREARPRRDERPARDDKPREPREPREAREDKPAREPREPREPRDGGREEAGRESREGREPREGREGREGRGRRDGKPRGDRNRDDRPREERSRDDRPRRNQPAEGQAAAGEGDGAEAPRERSRRGDRSRRERAPRPAEAPLRAEGEAEAPAEGGDAENRTERTERTRRRRRGGRGRNRANGERAEARPEEDEVQVPSLEDLGEAPFDDNGDEAAPEGLPEIPLEDLDQELVRAVSLEVTDRLVRPIIGEAALSVDLTDGRIKVAVDCGENSGLLIGREGQTLSALQYLASRIVARRIGAAVRVQLDTGDYRERQDEKLRELAVSLAEKVRATGKPQSTRPLSSYHRRVVHLVLQDDEELQTRSKGDGPMKRVVIMRRRKPAAAQ